VNVLHYWALQIARNDFKKKVSRAELDLIGRARPTIWSNYLMASTAIKAITQCTSKGGSICSLKGEGPDDLNSKMTQRGG